MRFFFEDLESLQSTFFFFMKVTTVVRGHSPMSNKKREVLVLIPCYPLNIEL